MSTNRFLVKKIDLELFIATLTDLWDKGVDYIDLAANEDETRMAIYFSEEYMSEEFKNHNKTKEEGPTNISDLDINQLI